MEANVTKNKPEKKRKPAKGGFGLPHILIAASIILSNAVLPIASNLVYNIITGFGETQNYLFEDISSILVMIATLAIYAVCGYFAFKNLGGLLRFIGTAFVATSIANTLATLVSMPVKGIAAIFVKQYLHYQDPAGMGMVLGTVFTYLSHIFFGLVAAAIGVLLLLLISKRVPSAKKKKAASEKETVTK